MDGNTVITVFSIFIAVYGIMPTDRRADITIRLIHGKSQITGVILLLAILYFLYWDFLNEQGFHSNRYNIPFSSGFNAEYALLSLVLVITLGAAILISLPPKFYIGHTPKWIKYSKILLEEQNLDELSKLLSKYCDDQINIITSESYVSSYNEALKNKLQDNIIYLLNDIDLAKYLSEHKPRTVNVLIQSGLFDDLIQTFLAVQISSPQSLFFKGSHEDSESKNHDAYRLMRNICEHYTFSSSSHVEGVKQTLIKIFTSPEIIKDINLPLSSSDSPDNDCRLHPIRLATNLYKYCYENSLNNKNTVLSPNFYDLAQIGIKIIENHIKLSDSDDNTTLFQSHSEYLIWYIIDTYARIITNNKSKNTNHVNDLHLAYAYLIRKILLSPQIRTSQKLRSLVLFIKTLQTKSEDSQIKILLLKEYPAAADSEEVRAIILDLRNHRKELSLDSSDTHTIDMIPRLFSKDN